MKDTPKCKQENPFETQYGDRLLPILALVAFATLAFATLAFATPQIHCPDRVHDFGWIYSSVGTKVEHGFQIRNTGDSDLKILRLRSCCGAKMRVNRKTIPPGSSAVIDVELSIRGRKGAIKKSLYMECNDPDNRLVQFRLEGRAVPQINFEPRSISFKDLDIYSQAEKTVKMSNSYKEPLHVTNIVCDIAGLAVEVEPIEKKRIHLIKVKTAPPLPPGIQTGTITLYTSRTWLPAVELQAVLAVTNSAPPLVSIPPGRPPVQIDYFYEAGCPACAKIDSVVLPKLEGLGKKVCTLNRYDISEKKNVERLMEYQDKLGMKANAPVSMVVDRQHSLCGPDQIRARLMPRIEQSLIDRRDPDWRLPPTLYAESEKGDNIDVVKRRIGGFALATLLLDGFVDGLNPCAIATLVFFASMLGVAGSRRKMAVGRQVLLTGVPFCIATFLTYTALGFGLLRALHLLSSFDRARTALEWAMIALLGCLAAISFRDAALFRKTSDAGGVLLQLPDRLKASVRSVIRERMKSGSLVLAGFSMGVLVTLLESVCTGQMYLPALVLVIESGQSTARTWGCLLAYNAMFIMPLAAILAAVYFGVSQTRLMEWSKRNVVLGKVMLGILFIVLAVLLAMTGKQG